MKNASSKSHNTALGGVVAGLAQVVSGVGVRPAHTFPRTDLTVAEALSGDWQRLGQDMRIAVRRVKSRNAG